MEKEAKQRISHRLQRTGLYRLAVVYMRDWKIKNDRLRTNIKGNAGAAWDDMWDKLEPLVRAMERNATKKPANGREFQGFDGNPDDIIDPDYSEPDAGKRQRDSWTWVQDNFRHIVRDDEHQTTLDINAAKSPPPTAQALQIAEEYARQPPGARRELFTHLRQFATKAHDNTPKESPTTNGGFLHEMDGDE